MLSDEVKEFIGVGGDAGILEVEKGAIRRFAEAVGDPNPLFREDEYGRNSRHGAIITVPGFFGWPTPAPRRAAGAGGGGGGGGVAAVLNKAGYTRILDGGMDYEFHAPIRAGDTLTANAKLKDVKEREGSSGKMTIVRNETTYYNQNGALVATAISTTIYR